MKCKRTYLYLEPYTFLNISKSDVLFYNSLDGSNFEFDISFDENKTINKLLDIENMYFVELDDKLLKDNKFHKLLSKLRQYYMGDLVELFKSSKPIQLKPEPIIITEKNEDDLGGNQKQVMKYLREVSIYLNNKITLPKQLNSAYKQYRCPINSKTKNELNFFTVKSILMQCEDIHLNTIKILGGEVFSYKYIEELLSIIKQSKQHFEICIYFRELLNILATHQNIKNIKEYDCKIKIFLFRPSLSEKVLVNEFINQYKNVDLYYFILGNNDLVEIINDDSQYLIDDINILPIFQDNLNFWENEVFYSKKAVNELFVNKQELLARQVINTINFGKIVILPNGDVYANVNHPKLGNIYETSLKDCIYAELKKKTSWFDLRKNHDPCTSCVKNLICPPISDIEYSSGINNLCKN